MSNALRKLKRTPFRLMIRERRRVEASLKKEAARLKEEAKYIKGALATEKPELGASSDVHPIYGTEIDDNPLGRWASNTVRGYIDENNNIQPIPERRVTGTSKDSEREIIK